MRELPILFNTEMVRALLDGRKTQTRRPIKLPDGWEEVIITDTPAVCIGASGLSDSAFPEDDAEKVIFPQYQVGDKIYVRETFWQFGSYVKTTATCNKLERPKERFVPCEKTTPEKGISFAEHKKPTDRYHLGWHKRPSLFMPKWAARIWRVVTGVRVERWQDISDDDILAEGVRKHHISGEYGVKINNKWLWFGSPKKAYETLIKSIYPGSWERNDWDFAYDIKTTTKKD